MRAIIAVLSQDKISVMQEMHAMSTASWSKDGYSYFLVGGSDDALIGKAAARFAERL